MRCLCHLLLQQHNLPLEIVQLLTAAVAAVDAVLTLLLVQRGECQAVGAAVGAADDVIEAVQGAAAVFNAALALERFLVE